MYMHFTWSVPFYLTAKAICFISNSWLHRLVTLQMLVPLEAVLGTFTTQHTRTRFSPPRPLLAILLLRLQASPRPYSCWTDVIDG